MRPIGRLILDRRIPPRIVVDHSIGRGQVQTKAADLQADQEQRYLAVLEAPDGCLAVAGIAGQQHVRERHCVESLFDEYQHAGEL
jgi:hypothetical protein